MSTRAWWLGSAVVAAAVSCTQRAGDSNEDAPETRPTATAPGRCEDRVTQLRREMAAMVDAAQLLRRTEPATLLDGQGHPPTADAFVVVTARELTLDGRPLGTWPHPMDGPVEAGPWREALRSGLVGRDIETVGLAVDREARWDQVAAAVEVLHERGTQRVELLWSGPAPALLEKSELAKTLQAKPIEQQLPFAWNHLHALTEPCPAAREAFRALAQDGSGTADGIIAEALPEALLECDCKADVEALGEATMVMLTPGRRIVATTVALGSDQASRQVHPAEARWETIGPTLAEHGRTPTRWAVDAPPAEPEPPPEPAPEPEPPPPPPPARRP